MPQTWFGTSPGHGTQRIGKKSRVVPSRVNSAKKSSEVNCAGGVEVDICQRGMEEAECREVKRQVFGVIRRGSLGTASLPKRQKRGPLRRTWKAWGVSQGNYADVALCWVCLLAVWATSEEAEWISLQ